MTDLLLLITIVLAFPVAGCLLEKHWPHGSLLDRFTEALMPRGEDR